MDIELVLPKCMYFFLFSFLFKKVFLECGNFEVNVVNPNQKINTNKHKFNSLKKIDKSNSRALVK